MQNKRIKICIFLTYEFLLLGLSNITQMAFIIVRKNLLKNLINVVFISFLKNRCKKFENPIKFNIYTADYV